MSGDQLSLNVTPFERGMAASDLAAGRWTPQQVRAVDDAIEWCARRYPQFTSDEIWARLWSLFPGFPVTKGLAGRLNRAQHRGVIVNSGRTRIADRGGQHDHAQRLTVWLGVR